jgi:hypothetical protein
MQVVQSCVIEVCRAVGKEGRKGRRHVSRSVLIDGMLGIRHWGIDYVLVRNACSSSFVRGRPLGGASVSFAEIPWT